MCKTEIYDMGYDLAYGLCLLGLRGKTHPSHGNVNPYMDLFKLTRNYSTMNRHGKPNHKGCMETWLDQVEHHVPEPRPRARATTARPRDPGPGRASWFWRGKWLGQAHMARSSQWSRARVIIARPRDPVLARVVSFRCQAKWS